MTEHDPFSRCEYRRLIAWPERIRREWPLIEEVLSTGPSRRVLEVGCGPGELVFLRLMDPLPDGRVRFYPSTLILTPGEDPPLCLERSREVLIRGWRRAEVEAALRDAGILPERALGGFDGAPFDPAESQDLILIARRAKKRRPPEGPPAT